MGPPIVPQPRCGAGAFLQCLTAKILRLSPAILGARNRSATARHSLYPTRDNPALNMATVLPPPSKRQRREDIERTQTQQDVAPLLATDLGSFKANFVDSDGNQMADVIEINFGDATERNVSTLLNTLLGRVWVPRPIVCHCC